MCWRTRMYIAMATHTTTRVLRPRIRNHQIIRTISQDTKDGGQDEGRTRRTALFCLLNFYAFQLREQSRFEPHFLPKKIMSEIQVAAMLQRDHNRSVSVDSFD